jgi:hypothetical protein
MVVAVTAAEGVRSGSGVECVDSRRSVERAFAVAALK